MIWYWDITFYETYFTTCMTIILQVVCYLYRDNVHGRQIYNLFVRALETGQTASLTRDFLSRCESITFFFFIFADNVRILCFSFMRKLSNLTTKWENHWTFWMGIYGGIRVRLVSIALLSTQDLWYQYTSDTSSIIHKYTYCSHKYTNCSIIYNKCGNCKINVQICIKDGIASNEQILSNIYTR